MNPKCDQMFSTEKLFLHVKEYTSCPYDQAIYEYSKLLYCDCYGELRVVSSDWNKSIIEMQYDGTY